MDYIHYRSCKKFNFVPIYAKNLPFTVNDLNRFMEDRRFEEKSDDDQFNEFGMFVGIGNDLEKSDHISLQHLLKSFTNYDHSLKNNKVQRHRNFEKNYEELIKLLDNIIEYKKFYE